MTVLAIIRTAGISSHGGVVLIQLGVGVDVTITPWWWRCGVARGCSLRLRFARTIRFGIRHCAYNNLAHDEYQQWRLWLLNCSSFSVIKFSYFILH